MRPLSITIILNGYVWVIASLWRIAVLALLASAAVFVVALAVTPYAGALVAAIFMFVFGAAAYQVRHSGTALHFPGVDRFFQRVPCYLSIQDRNLRIVRTNKLFRRHFGDRIGEHCYKVYKGTDEICDNCPVIKSFEDGLTHSTEETVVTKDGLKAHMIVYTTPVHDENGQISGVMEMSTDITRLKQLQEQIEEGQERFQNLFEGVPCYISIQDRDLNIIGHNNRFGAEFGESIGQRCYRVYKKRGSVCPDCPVAKTFEDGQVHSREETVVTRDGYTTHMLVHSSPIHNDKGERIAVMEMSTDITQVKLLQRELTHMGRTVAVMAHRIKNILMGLEGGIFVVNTGLEDDDRQTMLKGWTMIERNVGKVSSIVKDLLYCSKEREMNFEMIDPVHQIRHVYELFKDRAARENITLKLDIPENMPQGQFDPDALHSLLTNLVINGIEACANDATEGKTSHFMSISAAMEDNGDYIIEVADSGPGIPGQIGEAVFDDFYSTKGREGTGLGLLVANKVAEEHGGSITFISGEGIGTIFKARFPANRRLQ